LELLENIIDKAILPKEEIAEEMPDEFKETVAEALKK